MLYWYNKDYPGNVAFDQYFQAVLKSARTEQIEYYPEYLESNRFPEDEQTIALRDYLERKYANRSIDVVVAVTDQSLDFLLKSRADIFPKSPIVYIAIKRLTPEQLTAGAGITGIVPANTHRETLDLALKLHPDTQQVFVVSGTPEHDKRFEMVAREQFQPYENKLTFNYLTDLPLEELIANTKNLPKHSIIFYLWQQTRNEHGQLLETYETLGAFAPFASAPIYGMGTGNLGKGIVGGYLGGSEANGTKMGEIVLQVLSGKRTQDIPVVNAPASYMFDWRELQRWNISEKSLPPGSIVNFREFTFWQLYKWRIVGVVALVALQFVLIAFLLIERRRRRIATETSRHLATIVEYSDDAILSTSLDGKVLSWNAGAELMYGYMADEMIGEDVSKLAGPDKKKESAAIIDRIKSGKNLDHFETTGMTKKGRQIDVSLAMSALRDERGRVIGASTIARDISERKQAEETLRQSETKFRDMADNAPVMIWISGIDKLSTYVNKQFLDFTGRTLEQELANGWTEGIHPDDYVHCLDTYTANFDGRNRFEIEYRLRRADGEYRWIFANGTPRFASDGEFLGYIGSCVDITERKESEVALTKAHAELSQLKNQLEAENVYLQSELQQDQAFGEIVGQSDAIKHVHFKISQVASTDLTVLIMGETGTGKELVARAVHGASNRKDRPLIKVNCGALSASLIESELFGHEKGAFTGAGARKLGRFELANGGTIFLDEIGELPLELQVKLLRVIQEGELERVGGTKTIKIDVRIIAATNRHLKREVDKGTFREDLWYRLNVFPITAPPLRQRKEDIPLLVEHFVKISAKKFGKTLTSLPAGTMQSLQAHTWPGNVRELANLIERSVIHSQGNVLRIVDRFEQTLDDRAALVKSLDDVEKDHIISVLEQTGWRIEGTSGAAYLLGLKPSTLRARMAKLGIQRRLITVA
ncbi:MAG TPA: ABC transporter substrate binding protein [Pyrinomonadaceae bacterium]|nr:ABC transporter substrate binding protein [Pyrinomonadaceae bacterium]